MRSVHKHIYQRWCRGSNSGLVGIYLQVEVGEDCQRDKTQARNWLHERHLQVVSSAALLLSWASLTCVIQIPVLFEEHVRSCAKDWPAADKILLCFVGRPTKQLKRGWNVGCLNSQNTMQFFVTPWPYRC